MDEHLWWLVAWALLTASMLWGFLTATWILGRRPRPSWRRVHWLSYPVFALSTVHSFTAGSDTRSAFALIVLAAASVEVLALLGVSVSGLVAPSIAGAGPSAPAS